MAVVSWSINLLLHRKVVIGMSGRKYKDGELTVPEGSWVLEVQESGDDNVGQIRGYQLIGGVIPENYVLDSHSGCYREPDEHWGWTRTLLVAREPFAVLTWEAWDGQEDSVPGRRLRTARQIHKGELGQYPPITLPKFAMVGGLPRGNAGRRDKRRNKLGWARLSEVAELAGKTVEQILTDFWPIIDYHWGGSGYVQPTPPAINIVEAKDASLITADEHQVPVETYSMVQVLQLLHEGHDFSNWWIRKGTAKAILYVVHFGHSFDSISAPV